MPEAQCMKYSIKPDQRETLVNWIARLNDRSTEVAEALAEGGFVAEAVFLETSDSGDHILIYTSAKDLQAGMEALSKSKLPLVQEFNQLLAESVDTENAVSLEPYFTPLDQELSAFCGRKMMRSNSALLTDAFSSLRCACGAAKRGC